MCHRHYALATIVSGGQTGVDRAALDAAQTAGILRGGWCPRGRLAEDGAIPHEYPLTETPSADYAERTQWNVRDSDATLIISATPLADGTAFTHECAVAAQKPCFVWDVNAPDGAGRVRDWLAANRVQVLNVAGPRESKHPGIYVAARVLLIELLESIHPDFG